MLHELLHRVSAGSKYQKLKCPRPMVSSNTVLAIDDLSVTSRGVTADAYTPEQCAALATEDATQAIKNAESYTWFAIASYLYLQDWSRTFSATYMTSSITRRSNETIYGPHLRVAQDDTKRLNPHHRRQVVWSHDEV